MPELGVKALWVKAGGEIEGRSKHLARPQLFCLKKSAETVRRSEGGRVLYSSVTVEDHRGLSGTARDSIGDHIG